MNSTSVEKDKYTRDKLLYWFNEAQKHYRDGFLKVMTDPQGRDAESYLKDLREKVAKGPGKGFDMDLTKTNEMNKATE